MGRRKNNPNLVKELLSGLWTMSDKLFEEKFNSLSSSDRSKISDVIDHMSDDEEDMPFSCQRCGNRDEYPECIADCDWY